MNHIESLALFWSYPCIFTQNGSTIFIHCNDIKFDPKQDLELKKTKLKEIGDRLFKLSNLLSSEFINKAPDNIVQENCDKLIDAENSWDALFKNINALEESLYYYREATEGEVNNMRENSDKYKVFSLGNNYFFYNS
jgi:hypothetical protein